MNKQLRTIISLLILWGCQNQSQKLTEETENNKVEEPTVAESKSDEQKVHQQIVSTRLETNYYNWLNEPLYLLGYQKSNPVFKSWKTNNLYQLADTLELFKTFADTLKPVHIDDNMIVYSTASAIVVEMDTEDLILEIGARVIDAAGTPDGRYVYYFTDYEKPIEILDLATTQTSKTDLFGWHLHIYGEHLYYAIGHPEVSGFIKLFRSPLNDLSQRTELLQGTFEEGMTFFPSDSLLGLNANLVTDIRPAIYNFKTKNYAFLDGIESEMNYPVLLPRTNQLGYYTISKFENRFFDLEFDFKSADELGIYE